MVSVPLACRKAAYFTVLLLRTLGEARVAEIRVRRQGAVFGGRAGRHFSLSRFVSIASIRCRACQASGQGRFRAVA